MEEQRKVSGEVVKLDYSILRDTAFSNCKMIYEGGRPPELHNVSITNCEFILEGAARNVQNFLAMIAQGGDAELVVHKMLGLTDWVKKDE